MLDSLILSLINKRMSDLVGERKGKGLLGKQNRVAYLKSLNTVERRKVHVIFGISQETEVSINAKRSFCK